VALVVGIALANVFSFGKLSPLVKFSFDFGRVRGSGNIVTQKRDLSGFSKIDAGGAYEIEIVAQKDFSVEVQGDDNLIEFVKTEVHGDTLEISNSKKFSNGGRIVIRVAAPDIEGIDVSGASNAKLTNVKNESLRIESKGASKVVVSGETKDLFVDLAGASRLDASELSSVNAEVGARGACHASVSVSGDLKADASGASRVNYSGNPQNVERKVSGASSVSGS
ncbi:MAG TPA: head GIN domain-containing protein, partial [Pyrinomonadaceae bacterium]|nr:head GIN domain-containing protein [Pyrinomonadaceae bacterium]